MAQPAGPGGDIHVGGRGSVLDVDAGGSWLGWAGASVWQNLIRAQ